jgi:hypothetical protein
MVCKILIPEVYLAIFLALKNAVYPSIREKKIMKSFRTVLMVQLCSHLTNC